MAPAKKDLEIVYNLQWKNVSGHGDDKANIVGMYDIPATTLNWETFKSYLLKNSGTTGSDVKVFYVSIDGREFPIESQLDFQIALYSFRERARNGDIITLKLDRICERSAGPKKRLRRSAEPPVEEEKIQNVFERNSNAFAGQYDSPPEWFKKYMKGLKKEIVEEVSASVMNQVSGLKAPNSTQYVCHHSRKSKVECYKRPRKIPLVLNKPDNDSKEIIKSLKMERKLDNKLEKLEQKTMKIKEKKLSLTRVNGDEIGSKSRPIGLPLSDDTEMLMDASAIGRHESMVPHMSGGETYQQEWEVLNTGNMEWTENTELRYAWGSEALKPVERNVSCPTLKPGEKGKVVVYLEIPRKSGNYECYWHFYHDGRRFGHWLGCRVIVDPSPAKILLPLKDIPDIINIEETASDPALLYNSKKKLKTDITILPDENARFSRIMTPDSKPLNIELLQNCSRDEEICDMGMNLQDLTICDTTTGHESSSSSDIDNQSIISIADSNSSVHSAPSDEFVVVPMPEEKKLEGGNLLIPLDSTINLEKINIKSEPDDFDANKQDKDNMTDLVTKTSSEVKSENNNESAYAYVTVIGQKISVPKFLLHADYLATAEDAPPPTAITPTDATEPITNLAVPMNDLMSSSSILYEVASQKNIEQNSTMLEESLYLPLDSNAGSYHNSMDNSIYSNVLSESMNNSNMGVLLEESMSHSNTGSIDNPTKSRLFVFPLKCPGFEVVYPPNSCPEVSAPPADSNTMPKAHSACPCGMTPCVHYDNCNSNSIGCDWNKSVSYPYQVLNDPPPTAFGYEQQVPQQTQNMIHNSYQELSLNDSDAPNTLHNRFSSYMKRRSTFNHALHCSGGYCRQPLYKTASRASTGLAEVGETLSQRSTEIPSNYQQKYRCYAAVRPMSSIGSQKPQSPTSPNEGQNCIPLPETIDRSGLHVIPDTIVSGAVNVASSAINTARSVLNMFSSSTRPGQVLWENAHWTTDHPDPREWGNRVLMEMGFWDRELNIALLERYNDDVGRVLDELLQ